MHEPKEISLLSFIASRDMVYIDGRLYFTVEGERRFNPRGMHFRVFSDHLTESVILRRTNDQESVRWDMPVMAVRDVAVMRGMSKIHSVNSLYRYSYPRRDRIETYALDRVQNGVVDFYIVKDTHGKKLKDGNVATVQGLRKIDGDPEMPDLMPDQWVFLHANDNDDKLQVFDPLLVRANAYVHRAGPRLLFTQEADVDAFKDFV